MSEGSPNIRSINGNAALSADVISDSESTRILRVLIDGRKLGDGGIGVYTENLILGLLESKRATVSVIGDVERLNNFSWQYDVEWINEKSKLYSLDEFLWMPKRIDFSRYDLFHEPHYTLPLRIPIPTVVTIHDLIHVTHPEKFYYPWIAKKLIKSAAKRADQVIFVSRSAKESYLALIPNASLNYTKLSVVPNAVQDLPKTSSKKTYENSYILIVASNNKPHKAIKDGILAYQAVKKELGEQAPDLVLVGYGSEEWLTNDLSESIHVRGSVSKSELLAWYSGAKALLVPSLAEGFCVPVLEALNLGIDVIARPVPAIRELIAGEGFSAEDFSIEALSKKIVEALKENHRMPTRENLLRFTRPVITKQILEIYEKAISK